MGCRIVNYEPGMDERLAQLLNIGWQQMRPVHPRDDKWPTVTPEVVALWREQGRLSEAGTFIAQDEDGTPAAVFSVSAGDAEEGTLHLFRTSPDSAGRQIAAETLAAAEEYLRESGMKTVVTERVDSRGEQRVEFLRQEGYYDPDPGNRSMTMLLQPAGHKLREVALRDERCRLVTWRDEYLGEWLHIRNTVFGGAMNEDDFERAFLSGESFDPAGWFFAKHGDELVGITCGLVVRNDDGSARGGYLTAVAVLDEYHGRGLGRALVTASLNYLVEREISPIALNTEPFRKAALALYANLGFVMTNYNLRLRKEL